MPTSTSFKLDGFSRRENCLKSLRCKHRWSNNSFNTSHHGEILTISRSRLVPPKAIGDSSSLMLVQGSGIAPFFPVPTPPSGLYIPLHIILFVCRVPLLAIVSLTYVLLCSWHPVGSLIKKAALWLILGIPGIWWIDIQIDGVKRG